MTTHQAQVISYPENGQEQVPADTQLQSRVEQDFLDHVAGDQSAIKKAEARQKLCLSEIAVLTAQNDWDQIVQMLHPLDEKEPDLVALGLDVRIRGEVAFALSHAGHPEQSIAEYEKCLQSRADDFFFVSSLAYVLYDTVYRAKNRKMILPHHQKQEYIQKAHAYFTQAQKLRPDGVTNYYRQGVLYKNIQNMDRKATPLFQKAVENWEAYDSETREKRHQERKNYIKALYNLASCLLKQGRANQARGFLEHCIEEDRGKDFIKQEHKYFALGKINHETDHLDAAVQDLEFAAGFTDPRNGDYIYELLARVRLSQDRPKDALQSISRIPSKNRRWFVRWTEGDCYLAQQEYDRARQVWLGSVEKDQRSRHKVLIRLARLEFQLRNYSRTLEHARQADAFHREKYHNPDPDGLFWMAAVHIRYKDQESAEAMISELKLYKPDYPMLGKLQQVYAREFEDHAREHA